MKTTVLPVCECLACKATLGAATGLRTEAIPMSGDINVCFTCGHVMAFGDDMRVREITDDEAYVIAGNAELLRLQKARGYVMKRRSA